MLAAEQLPRIPVTAYDLLVQELPYPWEAEGCITAVVQVSERVKHTIVTRPVVCVFHKCIKPESWIFLGYLVEDCDECFFDTGSGHLEFG